MNDLQEQSSNNVLLVGASTITSLSLLMGLRIPLNFLPKAKKNTIITYARKIFFISRAGFTSYLNHFTRNGQVSDSFCRAIIAEPQGLCGHSLTIDNFFAFLTLPNSYLTNVDKQSTF